MKQTLKYIYDKLYQQIRYAEGKHSVAITLATALTVFSATYTNNNSYLIVSLSAIAIVFSLISVVFGFFALSAINFNSEKSKRTSKNINLFFYKDIASLNKEDLVRRLIKNYHFLKGYSPDNFDFDLAAQVISMAKSIQQKFLFFNFSLVFLVASLLCELLAVFLLGVGY